MKYTLVDGALLQGEPEVGGARRGAWVSGRRHPGEWIRW